MVVCSSYKKRKANGLQNYSCFSVCTFKREKHFLQTVTVAVILQSYTCNLRKGDFVFTFDKIHFRNLIHDGSENKPTGETKLVPNGAK